MRHRVPFAFLLIASLALAPCLARGQQAVAAAKRPNIVFLLADDQRADTIGAHGNPHIQTPNLDRLSRQGFSFLNNYCAGSYSGAVCVASRSMVMTGRHWMRIKDRKNWQGMTLLPETLSENGYRTFITGKWHNGKTTLCRAFQSGKAVFLGGMCDHTKVPVQDLTENDELVNERTPRGFSSQLFADAAIGFLEEAADGDEPFFLYAAFTAPHDPRNPPVAFRQMYYDNPPPLPENFRPMPLFDNGHASHSARDESLAPWPRPEEMIRDQLCEYYGLITHLDRQVGRILRTLREKSLLENTYIIYSADHGLALGSHGYLGKQNLFEQSMKCPLIIRGPGVPAGESTESLTYLLDVYATACAMAHVSPPAEVDSKDLSVIWKGDATTVRNSLFLPFQDKMRSVRDGRWKLHVYPHINHQLLFDLESDPHEMHDLAANPEYREELERMTTLLRSWQANLDDEQPLRVDTPGPMTIEFDNAQRRLDPWQPKWIRDKYFGGRSPASNDKGR